jgi:ferredoxin-NADP reductase
VSAVTSGEPASQATSWSTGRVAEVERVGDRLVRLRLEMADRIDHVPGQHCILRLRAEDGYTAQRSYSIASDPDDPLLELMVECLPGGEVSGFLHDEIRVDDVLEVRGPIGGWFTWTGDVTALGIAGGSGVVPLVSMQRYAARLGLANRLRLVVVGRTLAELPYARELLDGGALVALTRENLGSRVAAPPYLSEIEPLTAGIDRAYVCGSVGFASFAERLLGEAGVRSDVVRVEQFGATG